MRERGRSVLSAQGQRPIYQAGKWEIDLARRELRNGGDPVALGGRAFEIVEVLVQSVGGVVTKNDLMTRVWPDAIVEENTLQVHISAVRKAFGSDRGIVETVSGRGYRLLGSWTVREESTSDGAACNQPSLAFQPFQTNLPASLSSLIGRTIGARHLQDLLSANRVVTLTGPGGIGKTALALEVARTQLPTFHGDVQLVELASLKDPALVASTVARALGLALGGEEISAKAVAKAVGGRKLLIVLDNCEHLIDATAELADTIVRLCPHTTILATSREILRIEGECVYRVPPLEVPDVHREEADYVLAHSSVQLFIARITLLRSDFASHGENLLVITTICRRLDGIPLAIEFAAARAATLGPQLVASQLYDRFALLAGGRRTALPRHQTLRATLDWSYDLLPEIERGILQRVAIFSTFFLLRDAGEVAATGDMAPPQIADRIASLVEKSLIAGDFRGRMTRYRLLETTRAYALEKLKESGEFQNVARRHAEHYRDLLNAAAAEQASLTAERVVDFRHCIDDVRAALDWAFAPDGDVSIGVALTIAAVPLWFDLSSLTEARIHVERALASFAPGSDGDARSKMQLLTALGGTLLITRGGLGAKMAAAFAEALEIADRLDDADYRLRALWGLFLERASAGHHREALALGQRFRTLATASTDPTEILVGERMMGVACHVLGDQDRAADLLSRVLRQYPASVRRLDLTRFQFDQRIAARSFYSRVLWLQGFADQALIAIEKTVVDARGIDHPTSLFYALTQAACPVALLAGELAAAERYVNELLDLAVLHAREPWGRWGQAYKAALLIKQGELGEGEQILTGVLASLPENAFLFHHTAFLAYLAAAFVSLGNAVRGLATINEAIERSERNEERWCVAELLRIKGDLVLLEGTPKAVSAAEGLLVESLAWADQQAALSWELRTSISLARLRQREQRTQAARELLASIYYRFTEGFATADLRAARAMIDALPSAASK
jgi:predicted ATPase/DNA-binding winged helix-turn-helix (wHTH) protein